MQKVLAVAAAAAFGLSASHAEALTTFQFSTTTLSCATNGDTNCGVLDGPDGNSRVFTVDGITVTAKGFRYFPSNDTRQSAFLGRFTGGLGVTNQSESGQNNTHVVDNINGLDFVEFVFSVPVKPTGVTLARFGDADISYNQGLFTNAVTTQTNPSGSNGSQLAVTLNNSLGFNLTFNLFADRSSGDRDDKFKIYSLTVQPVPIPAALPLFAAAIAGLGGVALRKRAKTA